MDDGVTIRTNWAEVGYRIYLIHRTGVGQRDEMMDVNEVLHSFAISLPEVHVANGAALAVMRNAFLARPGVSLEAVHHYRSAPALGIKLVGRFFIKLHEHGKYR